MIYLDHAAATPVADNLAAVCGELLKKYSGNPEAAHRQGHDLRKELKNLEKQIFSAVFPRLKPTTPCCCIFGSDATSLINALGLTLKDRVSTAWASELDHIANKQMLKRTFPVVINLQLDNNGIIQNTFPDKKADFIFVTHVQSEIGCRQSLPELLKNLRNAAPEALILTDMVQSAGTECYPSDAPLPDLALLSGSKFGAPGGAVLLAIGKHSSHIAQQFHLLRSKEHIIGKPDMFQSAALTFALQLASKRTAEKLHHLQELNLLMRQKLSAMQLPNGQHPIITVPYEKSSPKILHFILPGYQAGVLVRMLSEKDVLISSGSACESESDQPSRILTALGYSRSLAYSGLRVSFSDSNTPSEVDTFCCTLQKILEDY